MNLNEAMKKWSVFQCLNLAFTFVLSSLAGALVGMFVSEYAWDIGLRLAVLVAGGLFLYWLGMQMVKAIKVQKRTFIQALAGNYISKMVGVWTVAVYFLLMYHLVLAWLYIAARSGSKCGGIAGIAAGSHRIREKIIFPRQKACYFAPTVIQ